MLQTIRRYGLMLIVRPIARLLFGLDVIGADKLPKDGPAIVAANHNSHVDTIVLLCLFPAKLLHKIRPVAAADHFDKGGFGSWFSKNIIGIIPIKRGGASRGEDVLLAAKEALTRGEILVVFPEGSRGEPEEMTRFKTGVARLVEFHPATTVTPVYLQGAGRSLPKDAKLLVPFNTTAVIGDALAWNGSHHGFVDELRAQIEALKAQAPPMRWE
ncbi:MAG: 1-acyl-sn-glycerol-3-phosphate acyltransferase [Alphaproteobacteria bacterium]|nr:MAG: 1-acyl-sn-glycerol-3-phosphate acyltransferase [Alphaproteobacteria bacterium]